MFIEDFLYKIKQDLISLKKYPDVNLSNALKIDYNNYWLKKRSDKKAVLSSWQKQRADYVLKMIEPNSVVLDLGCGDGAVLKYLHEKANIKGLGVDVSSEILKKAEKIGVKTIKMDISKLDNLSNLPKVDYVLGFEIIEHIPNTEEFIFKIRDKAKKGLIFSFPNTGYYVHRLRLLFGRFPLQWIQSPGEHLRFWTVKDVKWWVSSMDFKLKKLIIYEGIPFLNKIMPKLFGQGIIIKITPKETIMDNKYEKTNNFNM